MLQTRNSALGIGISIYWVTKQNNSNNNNYCQRQTVQSLSYLYMNENIKQTYLGSHLGICVKFNFYPYIFVETLFWMSPSS